MKTNVMNKRKEISNTQENSYLWLKIQVWIFFIDFEIVFFSLKLIEIKLILPSRSVIEMGACKKEREKKKRENVYLLLW